MIAFSNVIKVLEKCDVTTTINGNDLSVYIVEAGNLDDLVALIPYEEDVNVGDILKSDNMYVTDYCLQKDAGKKVAILVDSFEKISEEEYERPEYFEVVVNGKFIRTERAKLRNVGMFGRPFISTTLSIKNAENSIFTVQLVGHYGRAKKLDKLENGTFIDVTARLSKVKYDENGRYELNMLKYIEV